VGREFAWSGINEAGLVISTMTLPETRCPEPDRRPPLEPGIWSQYLLDTCATVNDVVQTDDKVRIQNNPDHYLICDETGNCAVIEFLQGRMVVRQGEDLEIPVLTNSTYPVSAAYWQRGSLAKWLFSSSKDKPDGSLHRFNCAANKVERFSPKRNLPTVNYAFKILDDVSMKKTRWSIVYDIRKRTIHFRTKDVPDRRLIRLKRLDFTCESPLLFMDINETFSGDVTDLFDGYDRQRNLDFMVSFCRRYSVSASLEAIEWLVSRFDSYPCVP